MLYVKTILADIVRNILSLNFMKSEMRPNIYGITINVNHKEL